MDERHKLAKRIEEQIEMEVAGDVTGLYGLIDPKIRIERESERADEPGLTMGAIRDFVDRIETADVTELHFSKWEVAHDGTPAVVAEISVIYNSEPRHSKFRTVWCQRDGNWYTSALSKRVFPKLNI